MYIAVQDAAQNERLGNGKSVEQYSIRHRKFTASMDGASFFVRIQLGMQQVQKMSLSAKVMSGVVVLFYLLSFIPRVEENLAMIPS